MTTEQLPLPEDLLELDAAYPGMVLADQVHDYAAQHVTVERERYAPLIRAVEQLLDAGYMDQEHLARLRAAWEAV